MKRNNSEQISLNLGVEAKPEKKEQEGKWFRLIKDFKITPHYCFVKTEVLARRVFRAAKLMEDDVSYEVPEVSIDKIPPEYKKKERLVEVKLGDKPYTYKVVSFTLENRRTE